MQMIDLMIKSNFKYTPTYDEWYEFWHLLKGSEELLEDPFINDIFLIWNSGKMPSPRQSYFVFKRVFPNTKIGKPPPRRLQPLKDFLNESKDHE